MAPTLELGAPRCHKAPWPLGMAMGPQGGGRQGGPGGPHPFWVWGIRICPWYPQIPGALGDAPTSGGWEGPAPPSQPCLPPCGANHCPPTSGPRLCPPVLGPEESESGSGLSRFLVSLEIPCDLWSTAQGPNSKILGKLRGGHQGVGSKAPHSADCTLKPLGGWPDMLARGCTAQGGSGPLRHMQPHPAGPPTGPPTLTPPLGMWRWSAAPGGPGWVGLGLGWVVCCTL